MVPYDTYTLYQIERAKSPGEIRCTDQQRAQFAIALSSLFRGVSRPVRAVWQPSSGRHGPAATPGLTGQVCDACRS